MTDDLKKAVWNVANVGDSYKEHPELQNHILEQYKLYVEMADRISERRDKANNFFLALNGLFLTSSLPLLQKFLEKLEKWHLIVPALVVFCILYIWYSLIDSYKKLNGAKFEIISELESRLPARVYGKAEWKTLLKEGKRRDIYWPLTHLELKTPIVFGLGYFVVFLYFFLKC